MYHSLAMEDLLDLYQLSAFLPKSFPSHKILEKYNLGMNWLSSMKYDTNELPHFNDCANGIAPTYSELKKYSSVIGIELNSKEINKFNYFKESGFAVYKDNDIHFIADIGSIGPDYLPAHAHADSLSFELAIKGHRLFVNSGTSEYGVSDVRHKQRSTLSHSTVEIDSKNSSEVWSGFRVARRAKIQDVKIDQSEEKIEISASHNGYKHLSNRPVHRRTWILSMQQLEIKDNLTGKTNIMSSRFYVHPDINVQQSNGNIFFKKENNLLAIMTASHPIQLLLATYHDHFGMSRQNHCLVIQDKTPSTSSISIKW